MKTDRFTKLALGIIALTLSAISIRPFLQSEVVDAQVTHPQRAATRQQWECPFVTRQRDWSRDTPERPRANRFAPSQARSRTHSHLA
jgi:hypothetical protein